MTARILIVTHPRDDFARRPYAAAAMARVWRSRGIEVVVQPGWTRRPAADLVIPHLDMTVWPDDFMKFLTGYPRVLNRRALDISKRRVSRNLVTPGSDWSGAVIVKTDANHAGIPEREARGRPAPWLRAWGAARRLLGRMSEPEERLYPVFDGIAEVPRWVWRDQRLVVEKFMPVADGAAFVLHDYFVLGAAVIHRRLWNAAPLIRRHGRLCYSEGAGASRIEIISPARLPPDIARYRDEFGLDFGKIDVLQAGERSVVIDVAHTPASPTLVAAADSIVALARGLTDYLPSARL